MDLLHLQGRACVVRVLLEFGVRHVVPDPLVQGVIVLQHVLGYFKDRLDGDSRAELLAAIEEYRRGLVPLIVPVTLIRHHVRACRVTYLAGQLYLEPHPKERILRNDL